MFDLKNEGQGQGGEKLELRHSTRNVRFYITDSDQNLAARQLVEGFQATLRIRTK